MSTSLPPLLLSMPKFAIYVQNVYRLGSLQGEAVHQVILCLCLALTSFPFFSSAGTSTIYPSDSIDPNSQVARWFSISRLTLSPSSQSVLVCSARASFEFANASRSLAISYAMSVISAELLLVLMEFGHAQECPIIPVSVCHNYLFAYSLHHVLSQTGVPRAWIVQFWQA